MLTFLFYRSILTYVVHEMHIIIEVNSYYIVNVHKPSWKMEENNREKRKCIGTVIRAT